MDPRTSLSPTNLALVAVFAGLLAASTLWPGLELAGGVPLTLQTLAVLIAGAVLGPWRGAAAVVLYLVVGTAGAPIFADRTGGPSVWAGPTAGFLGAFVVAAFVTGWMVRGMRRAGTLTTAGVVGATAVGSLVVINAIGWTFFAVRLDWTASDTIAFAALFQPGDIIKVFAAGIIAAAVHRAYPGLLGTTRAAASAAPAQAAPATAASEGETLTSSGVA